MSAQPQPYLEYLDVLGVAEHTGLKRDTIYVYLARGSMPEPDMIWLRHPLWLPETINEWRSHRYERRKTAAIPRSRKIRRPDQRRHKPPPKVRAKPPSKGGALPTPGASSVAPEIAKQVAAALRATGVHCTTDDVIALANYDGDLDHERQKLKHRIDARLRAIVQRERG